MAKNVAKVQTPGESAATAEAAGDQTQTQEQAKTTEADAVSAGAEISPSRAQYAQLHSSEVDPSTLKSAVLCKDGWLCPPVIGQQAK